MGKLRNAISFLKKNEFLAVTALCAGTVLVILLGFTLYALISGVLETVDKYVVVLHPEDGLKCTVEFKDEDFGMAVAAALEIEYAELTEEDLLAVTRLTISDDPAIDRLDDVALMPALEQLTLTNCSICSISALSSLKELKSLNVSGNQIVNVSDILFMTELESLNLSANPIRDVPLLKSMECLTKLNLDNTKINNLDFLIGTNIEELHISYTDLPHLEILAQCDSLNSLYLYGYNEMDLSPLHHLENFHSIFLSKAFDRAAIDFMLEHFKSGDRYSKVYLVLKNRGMDTHG